MENTNNKKDGEKEKTIDDINREITDIFSKSAKEGRSTQQMVGSGSENKKIEYQEIRFNPHNFRRWFSFSKEGFNPVIPTQTQPNLTSISYGDNERFIYPKFKEYEHKPANYGHEHHYKDFLSCTIKVKKNEIEIVNKIATICNVKWFSIKGKTSAEIDQEMRKIKDELEFHCIRALKLFVSIHGGKTDFQPIAKWYKGENKIGHDSLESIRELQFHTEVDGKPLLKKVYQEPVIEHYTEFGASNHAKNLALNDFSPIIANEINQSRQEISDIRSVIKELAEANKGTAQKVNYLAEKVDYLAVNINTHIPYLQKLSISTEANTKSAAILGKQAKKIANALRQPKWSKPKPKPRRYGLTDEELKKRVKDIFG